ncbi:MAG: IS110 family transposase, partial [Candidatus Berkiella sp.]
MKLYAGIDLHSNNSFISIIDETDNIIKKRRLSNELPLILDFLKPYADQLIGIVIESTFNWYWLVDGLIANGFSVHLANTTAIQQYQGIKYTDDDTDATWLAQMLRLDLLPQGYIYPKEERYTRDLLRKRAQLVQQRTTNLLSIQTIISRQTGQRISGNDVKTLQLNELKKLLNNNQEVYLAASANLRISQELNHEIKDIEKYVKSKVKLRPEFKNLHTVPGIGDILALSIMLETGDISRFKEVGDYSSYCRCVSSKRLSNGKKKGENNRKNGNKYLCHAFVEAAHFAIRYEPVIKKFYQKKSRKTKQVIAIKAIANKL